LFQLFYNPTSKRRKCNNTSFSQCMDVSFVRRGACERCYAQLSLVLPSASKGLRWQRWWDSACFAVLRSRCGGVLRGDGMIVAAGCETLLCMRVLLGARRQDAPS
jgi:hypothetical protein